MIRAALKQCWQWYLKMQGLQMSSDCRFMGFPRFGSEPYLVSIGRHVTISSGVSFITHDGGTWVFREQEKYRNVIKYGRIVINDNCFIGARAIIMPGVSVGPNAIVAAGSIVTKSVAPNTVVGGVPARFLSTVDTYAEKALRDTPNYEIDAYLRDKRRELLRTLPVPSVEASPEQENEQLENLPLPRAFR